MGDDLIHLYEDQIEIQALYEEIAALKAEAASLRSENERLRQGGAPIRRTELEALQGERNALKAENERLRKQLEATTAIAQMRGNAAGAAESRLAIAVEALEKMPHPDYCEYWNECKCAKAILATLASKDGEGEG